MWINHSKYNKLRLDAVGGFGKNRICIHVDESAPLQKLRLDAVGRVWWELDVASSVIIIPLAQKNESMPCGGFGSVWIVGFPVCQCRY